jgi:hypothetical protein
MREDEKAYYDDEEQCCPICDSCECAGHLDD